MVHDGTIQCTGARSQPTTCNIRELSELPGASWTGGWGGQGKVDGKVEAMQQW